jgi:hypothetical protein
VGLAVARRAELKGVHEPILVAVGEDGGLPVDNPHGWRVGMTCEGPPVAEILEN